MNQLFISGGQSIRASASILPMNILGWFPLGLTGLISLLSRGFTFWMVQAILHFFCLPAFAQTVPAYFIHCSYQLFLPILQGLQRLPLRRGIGTFFRMSLTCWHLEGPCCLLLGSLSQFSKRTSVPSSPIVLQYTLIPAAPLLHPLGLISQKPSSAADPVLWWPGWYPCLPCPHFTLISWHCAQEVPVRGGWLDFVLWAPRREGSVGLSTLWECSWSSEVWDPERNSWHVTQPSDGLGARPALSCPPDIRLPDTDTSILALAQAFHQSRGGQDPPGTLPAMPACEGTALSCCMMGSDTANMECQEKLSVIVAQTSSVSERCSRPLPSWRLLTFRNKYS